MSLTKEVRVQITKSQIVWDKGIVVVVVILESQSVTFNLFFETQLHLIYVDESESSAYFIACIFKIKESVSNTYVFYWMLLV